MYFITHYTLLPEKEIKTLKVEYRIRVVVVFLFFISCAIIIGIFSLLPSYILSYTQEKNSIQKVQSINSEISNESELYTKELLDSYKIVKKINSEQGSNVVFSDYLKKVNSYKNDFILFNSFQISKSQDASSTAELILQGKSTTRNSILQLKKNLESDPAIIKVELPLSDLTKSKDIDFAFKIKFK